MRVGMGALVPSCFACSFWINRKSLATTRIKGLETSPTKQRIFVWVYGRSIEKKAIPTASLSSSVHVLELSGVFLLLLPFELFFRRRVPAVFFSLSLLRAKKGIYLCPMNQQQWLSSRAFFSPSSSPDPLHRLAPWEVSFSLSLSFSLRRSSKRKDKFARR